jgi:DNA modification methylase
MTGFHTSAAWTIAMEAAGFSWLSDLLVLWNRDKAAQSASFGSLSSHVLWFARPGARHTWNSRRKSIQSNVIVCSKIPIQDRSHPAQKPLELTNLLVSLLTLQSDIILDPFCGSGGTLVSAEVIGRPFIGMDKDSAHVATSRRRVKHWELEPDTSLHLWVNGKLEEI